MDRTKTSLGNHIDADSFDVIDEGQGLFEFSRDVTTDLSAFTDSRTNADRNERIVFVCGAQRGDNILCGNPVDIDEILAFFDCVGGRGSSI